VNETKEDMRLKWGTLVHFHCWIYLYITIYKQYFNFDYRIV